MNYKKSIFFFIIFLLSAVSFSSFAQPYVRIEELDQQITHGVLGGDIDIIYDANPTVKLYADAECTIPYTTTTDLEVVIRREETYGELSAENSWGNMYGSSDDNFTVTVPAGHSSYAIGGASRLGISMTSITYYYWSLGSADPYPETMYTLTQSFHVAEQSGYEALPSVERPYEIRYESVNNQTPDFTVDYRFYE